jgi:molybdopterin-guanine dinucleotide biosynthesis protein A
VPQSPPRIAAAILAGGRGERLGGVNKALIEIGGRTMLDRVAVALVRADPILVCGGPNAFPVGLSHPVIPDLDTPYGGPLAGAAAAVDALAKDPPVWLLTTAGDTPFLPADFMERALALHRDADVVLGAYAGQDYPTNALWRYAAIAELPAQVRNGTAPHSLRRLAAGLRTARLDYAGIAAEDPFANANTPEELAALRARATQEIAGKKHLGKAGQTR